MSSPITTHVLDTATGRPAPGIHTRLEFSRDGLTWNQLGEGITNTDGRIRNLLPEGTPLEPGLYRLTFETGPYFSAAGTPTFYPWVPIVFELGQPEGHYHVPLLISPYGYSTYRGS